MTSGIPTPAFSDAPRCPEPYRNCDRSRGRVRHADGEISGRLDVAFLLTIALLRIQAMPPLLILGVEYA